MRRKLISQIFFEIKENNYVATMETLIAKTMLKAQTANADLYNTKHMLINSKTTSGKYFECLNYYEG